MRESRTFTEVALQAAVLGYRTTRISRHARTSSRREKKGSSLAAAFVRGQRLRPRVRIVAASGQLGPDAAADIRPDAGAYAVPITFNLCSSRSLNRQTFGDRPQGSLKRH